VSVDDAARLVAALLDGLLFQKVLRPELDLAGLWREAEEILLRGLASSEAGAGGALP
jgi:hypothetical protein